MSWYKTGTITVTNGSAAITGSGTLWTDVGTLNAGDILSAPDGKQYEILTLDSNTGITLASNYLGTSLSGQAYSIYPIGLLPSSLAQQVKATLSTANTALASAVRYDTAAMGLTGTQQTNARTNIAALGTVDVGCGYLSKSVAGGVDVTLSATEAANQFITLTGTLTSNINVIVQAAARLFFIYNNTSGAYTVTIKTPSGTGTAVAQGGRALVECDATNVVNPISSHTGNLALTGTLTAGLVDISGASAGQIRFPAAQNASSDANTLDDYEEGTWNATVTFGGGATGQIYGTQLMAYVKVGRKVTISGYLNFTNKGSASGTAAITGLPFTAGSSMAGGEAGVAFSLSDVSYAGTPHGRVDGGTTAIQLFQSTEAGTRSFLSNSNFSNSSEVTLSASYFV